MSEENSGTKQRILAAAREVFAERGVAGATVREISAKAGANQAAVHYHFGSKEKLLMAVLAELLLTDEEQYPVNIGLGEGATTRDRLLAYIRSILYRLVGTGDPQGEKLCKLFAHELFDPSENFDGLMERFIRPQHSLLLGIMRELLPADTPERTVHLCTAGVFGQCLFFDNMREVIRRICPEIALDRLGVEFAAKFIFEFALAGIERMGERQDV
ncbi:MAG: CerR family C-terminal domain-containing protein [Humidesulfovibrio sp.]|nr:CerR family C-terminal domain-containing protein [Humidesulfovibrio sp.]